MGSHTWHHGCDTIWLPGFVRKHEVSHSAFPTYPVLQIRWPHCERARRTFAASFRSSEVSRSPAGWLEDPFLDRNAQTLCFRSC